MEKKYWFKAKRYGWGWYPSSWQGWLIIGIYTFFAVAIFKDIDNASHSGSDTLIGFVLPFVLLTLILLLICYKTGEKPRWRWGE